MPILRTHGPSSQHMRKQDNHKGFRYVGRPASRSLPHSGQYTTPFTSGLSVPQLAHVLPAAVPQKPQYFQLIGISCRQDAHIPSPASKRESAAPSMVAIWLKQAESWSWSICSFRLMVAMTTIAG